MIGTSGGGWSRDWKALLGLLAAFTLAGCHPHEPHPRPTLTVFAAASLTLPLTELAPALEAAGKASVTFSFGASGSLAKQVAAGAPADLFLSADPEWVDFLVAEGVTTPENRFRFAQNRLVVVTPRASTATLADLADLEGCQRVAVADIETAPAGKHAREALDHAGVWPALEPRIIRAMNVRAALALVERGEADAGIVYATDAAGSDAVRIAFEIEPSLHRPILYEGAVLTAQGTLFRDLLLDPAGQAVLHKYGFAESPR